MLTDSQRDALTSRLRKGRAQAAGIPRRTAGQDENLPLSFAQEQLWVIDRFAPGQVAYNVPQALRLSGPLDVAALAAAVSMLAARHETLRTRLVTGTGGDPVAVIDPPAPVPLPETDLSGLAPGERAARLTELIETEAIRPFSLAAGPLFRVRLIRLARDDRVLLAIFHHVIFDGWSAGVLVHDLAALYHHEAVGEPAALAPLPVQYADYALWERGRLTGPAVAELERFWREVLDGYPTVRFPADRLRPLTDDGTGGLVTRTTDRVLRDELTELSQRQGTTVFVTLLAGLFALLHRYTGQADLVVGTVTASRGRPELAPLIGFCVNTLPIRADASGDPPFCELIERVRQATVGAYAYQDLPFARIVSALRAARDPGRSPLFQIALSYADRDSAPVRAAGVDFVRTDLIAGISAAKFDLDFTTETRSDGLWVECSYKTALFDAERIHRLLEHYEVLLRGAVANPSARISRLPLLGPAELHAELALWNRATASYPRICVHEGFEAQVRRSPTAIAAEFGPEQVTYADLNSRADAIAARLRELGVRPERLVGVCMGTSISRLAALLGIWKAGGGYVPLDPALPPDRLAFMIANTGVAAILTDDPPAGNLPATPGVLRVTPELEHRRGPASGSGPSPGCVAYVIYTSGSTGRPKGVVIEHRQAANFLYGMIDTWRVGPSDSVLQFASLNFDASVQEMFMPLLAGGRVVLAAPETLHTPRRLISLLRDRGITFAVLTPSVVRLLRDEEFPRLRVMMCGGEEMPPDLVARWLRPGLAFVNDYGPTETAVTAVFAELTDRTPLPPPIGLPSPNYQAYVLDRHLNPVPPGVTGELHIGGAGVARGYLNCPALTSQRFVPDPFRQGGRVYKTGDLCRRRPDGSIVFTGRTDRQVKLRGLRIELGEIESVLATHPGVAEAVVTVTSDPAGELELTGYLRLAGGISRPDPADVRAHATVSLPGYMVPAHLVILDEFPLNASGKIDRGALPAPVADPVEPSAAPVQVTPTETTLIGLFASVLHRPSVSVTDDFFASGGNSLQVMRLIDLIAGRTGADLAPAAVFLHPTPRKLAAHLDSATAVPADLVLLSPGSSISPGSSRPGLILIHPIGGTVTDYATLAAGLASTVRGLQAPGLSAGSFAPATLADLVGHYTTLIKNAQPDGPYRLGGWSMGGVLAYEITRRLELDGATVEILVLLDPPYDVPSAGRLTRAQVAGHFVADVAASLGRDPPGRPDSATDSSAGQIRWLADCLGDGDAADPAGSAGLAAQLARRFEVFARHTELLADYRPAADGAVHARALLVSASRSPNAPARFRWRRHLRGPADTLLLDSEHYEFLRPPLVTKVASAIAAMARN